MIAITGSTQPDRDRGREVGHLDRASARSQHRVAGGLNKRARRRVGIHVRRVTDQDRLPFVDEVDCLVLAPEDEGGDAAQGHGGRTKADRAHALARRDVAIMVG